jgi:hypothetical protein
MKPERFDVLLNLRRGLGKSSVEKDVAGVPGDEKRRDLVRADIKDISDDPERSLRLVRFAVALTFLSQERA